MEKIKVLVIRPNKEPYVEEIKNNMNDIYGLVYYPYRELKLEENLYLISTKTTNDFPLNRVSEDIKIHSNFIIIAKANTKFISLTEQQIKKYSNIFKVGN